MAAAVRALHTAAVTAAASADVHLLQVPVISVTPHVTLVAQPAKASATSVRVVSTTALPARALPAAMRPAVMHVLPVVTSNPVGILAPLAVTSVRPVAILQPASPLSASLLALPSLGTAARCLCHVMPKSVPHVRLDN